jgi:hypothetical protein
MKPETETKKRRERLKGMINNAETNRDSTFFARKIVNRK